MAQSVFLAVFLATVGLTWAQPAPTGSTSIPGSSSLRPNIILIVADGVGYGDIGCYGQKRIETPNLDRMAAAGIRFTNFYAGSSVPLASRCVLMTGRHTGHATIRGEAQGIALKPEDGTLSLLLQGTYMNALMGQWGLGGGGSPGSPGLKGFDEFAGYLDHERAQDYFPTYVDRFDTNEGLFQVTFPANANDQKGAYFPDVLQTAALNFIRINKPDRFNGQKPFFLLLAPTLLRANSIAFEKTGNGMQVPDDSPYASRPWPQPEKNKAAMITRLDRHVGAILDRLREYRQETNTLILFTSSTGPHKEGGVDPAFFTSAGPFRGHKGDLYEGGIRVPLIAVWPGKIPAGRVSDEPWAFWDLYPTLAEAAGKRPPRNSDGLSFLATLLGRSSIDRHAYFYWESHEGAFKQAARVGDWKGIRLQPGSPIELYNLAADPGEARNVAGENPDMVARIEGVLNTARADALQYPVKKAQAAGDAGKP